MDITHDKWMYLIHTHVEELKPDSYIEFVEMLISNKTLKDDLLFKEYMNFIKDNYEEVRDSIKQLKKAP